MSEWKTYRLGDICQVLNGRAYKQEELLNQGPYPVLRVGNILQGNNWYYSDLELPDDKYCYNGDLLYAWSCGFAPYIWKGKKSIYHYHIWKLKENTQIIDKLFFYYYLIIHTKYNLGGTHGSVMLHLTKKDFENQTLHLPPLDEQRRIAGILGSLDDKIELNRRLNANLEAQAQALFRSWFVDFEPFRDGPFVDSELGKIPQGWKVLLFSDFCEHSTQKVEDRTVTEYSVTNSGMFPREQKYTKQLSQNISKDKLIRKRDLVFGMSREILNWGIMKNDQEGGVSAAYTVYHIKDEIDSTYLENYITFHKPYFKDLIKPAAREGQGIDKKIFENKILYYPPQNVLNNFFAIYNTLITNNQNEEIKTLSALRDTLLPQLMAGEINVK